MLQMHNKSEPTKMKQQFLQTVAHEEAVFTILVQLVGMFLILSSTVMFVKQESLHKLEHVLQMNILWCSTVFLLVDWILVLPGTLPCEMFSFVFIVFGSVGTLSTVGIAWGRYKKMMGLSYPSTNRIWSLIVLLVVWLASLLLIVYPVWQKIIMVTQHLEFSEGPITDTICFFQDNFLYDNSVTSTIFLFGAVILPFCLISFFYIQIFRKIRKARLSSWLNHIALQRSRQTQVIQCAGRKANVFQLTSPHPDDQNAQRFNRVSFNREKSVLFKGLFASVVVVLCWLPFTAVWLHLSVNGFRRDYLTYVRYLVINAKLSVILNVAHYICFNVRYRNLYIQTVFGPFTNFLQSLYTEADEITCPIESQIVPCQRSSGFEKSLFTTRNSRMALEPIQENQSKDKELNETKKSDEKRQKRSRRITSHRALSLPHRLTINRISPVDLNLSNSVV